MVQSADQTLNASLLDSKSEKQLTPRSSGSSTHHHSGLSSATVSPNGLTTPLTTPIGENTCLVGQERASPAILDRIKPSIQPNGSFDIASALESVPLSEILGDLVDLCKDQLGSRFLQQLVDSGRLDKSSRSELVERIVPHATDLTSDAFGNYVVQKTVDFATDSQRAQLFAQLKGQLFPLSVHMYGCRVVQRLIERSTLKEQVLTAEELRGHVIECVEDQNGNHVIQKLIEKLPSQRLVEFIVSEFLGHISVMAVHCYGCRVVQRLLEKLDPEDSRSLVAEILANLWQLAQDQYGNYVVQHVLVHGTSQSRSVIVQVIASHIIDFSCHKFASNIAEKALLSCEDQASRDLLIGAVIGSGGTDAPLHVLMKDRFANYVIQRCIELSQGAQKQTLVEMLRAHLPALKRVIYGKHIATAIERIITL
jgi:pumilio RNA-binding family